MAQQTGKFELASRCDALTSTACCHKALAYWLVCSVCVSVSGWECVAEVSHGERLRSQKVAGFV